MKLWIIFHDCLPLFYWVTDEDAREEGVCFTASCQREQYDTSVSELYMRLWWMMNLSLLCIELRRVLTGRKRLNKWVLCEHLLGLALPSYWTGCKLHSGFCMGTCKKIFRIYQQRAAPGCVCMFAWTCLSWMTLVIVVEVLLVSQRTGSHPIVCIHSTRIELGGGMVENLGPCC